MKIFITGQASLHWGRMEFGNIGTYYVVEPFFEEIVQRFENVEIQTTLQMSECFSKKYHVTVLPLELFYGYNGHEFIDAKKEYEIICEYEKTGKIREETPYIRAVLWADIVIDLSIDLWGDNAYLQGKDRFAVGLYKDRVAQKLRPTYMLDGTTGPFAYSNETEKEFAKEVYKNFKIVTNRESESTKIMKAEGFDTANVVDCACTSFLFKGNDNADFDGLVKEKMVDKGRPIIGVIVCGWNFSKAPYTKWPRDENEYCSFLEMCEYLDEHLGANVFLMSHANAFPIPPKKFELQFGRDYPIACEMKRLLDKRGVAKNIYLQDQVMDVWTTKGIIGKFDMLISGRMHGGVAGISQCVPTVILDYGHEPKAHKLKGIAESVHMEEYMADPCRTQDIIEKIRNCWDNKEVIKENLKRILPEVQEKAKANFSFLSEGL